ncbi:hypothetical protein D3C78_1543550 [compost metagenome]
MKLVRPSLGLTFSTIIDSSADRKIAVPVADTGSSLNTAAMAVSLVTIGAVFITS